jgi:hypothetical protein
MRADLLIQADVTPGFASGQPTYIDSSLIGWDYGLFRNGLLLTPQVDYQVNSNGFTLSSNVAANDEFILRFSKYNPVTPDDTTYTNGIDINLVLPALEKRLGWRQPLKAGSIPISTNAESLSGRYFQDFHGLVTIPNIKSTMEEEGVSNADLNTYLLQLQDSAIMRCLSEVFRESSLIEQKLMYTRFGTMDLIIQNGTNFCGYMINIANDFSISTQITECTLYFDADVSFNLYVYQDGVKTPIRTIPVACKAYERTIVQFDRLYLTYKTGRKYYIGYFQEELGAAHAIQEMVDTWASTFCFEAVPLAAPKDIFFGFNHNYRMYTALPRGLNLEIITFYDHTQQILGKTNLFDEAIGLSMAVMVLEQITTSTRGNLKERLTKEIIEKAYMDLNQAFPTKDIPVTPGLKSRLIAEYSKLTKAFYKDTESNSINRNTQGGFDTYNNKWATANFKQMSNPAMTKS